MKNNGFPIIFPEIEDGLNLKIWIEELGFCQSGMNGPEQLSNTEIKSWSDMTGTMLTPNEFLILRHLSNEFVGQYHKSDIECDAPYSLDEDADIATQGLYLLSLLDA